jgi:hypothetical protein
MQGGYGLIATAEAGEQPRGILDPALQARPPVTFNPGDIVTHHDLKAKFKGDFPEGVYKMDKDGAPRIMVAGEKPTEGQETAAQMSVSLESAVSDLASFEEGGENADWMPGKVETMANQGWTGAIVPDALANAWVSSPTYQLYSNIAERWSTAYAKIMSGTAVRPDELESFRRQFFRRPGDTDAMIKQKQRARAKATEAARKKAAEGLRKMERNPG